jgi:hypothetical protein
MNSRCRRSAPARRRQAQRERRRNACPKHKTMHPTMHGRNIDIDIESFKRYLDSDLPSQMLDDNRLNLHKIDANFE